jgi:hypothetical protein
VRAALLSSPSSYICCVKWVAYDSGIHVKEPQELWILVLSAGNYREQLEYRAPSPMRAAYRFI